MAAPVYNTGVSGGIADGGSTTFETGTLTPGGSNRAVLVYVQSSDGSPADVSAVKYGGSGGTSLTQLGSFVTFGTFVRSSLWGSTNFQPAASANTIHVTWASSQGERLVMAVAIEDVDQTTRFGTPATDKNDGGNMSLSVTGIGAVVDDLIVDFGGVLTSGSATTFTATASQTERFEGQTTGTAYDCAVVGTKVATSTSESRTWTASANNSWVMFGVAVKQVSGGAASVAPMAMHHFRKRRGGH